MKIKSIGFKIMLWFTLVLTIIVSVTYLVIISISYQIIHKGIKDTLIQTVQNNLDEFEFYASIDNVMPNNTDRLMYYENGYLQISATFLYNINEVYTGIYQDDATLLYGENPISIDISDLAFADSTIQQVKVGGTLYYIFDKKIPLDGANNLWLRGVISEEQGVAQIYSIAKLSLIIFPIIIFISAIGGYIIVQRMLSPIRKISTTAVKIGEDGDLKKRIDIGKGNDELHELAGSFNNMLNRLEEAFAKEQQFTSDASHELRTPVSVISAQCQLSLEQDKNVEEYKEALYVIKRQSGKMSKLINDMLDFTRLEMKSDNYEMLPICMTELVSDLCSDMALIQENGITLTYEVEPNITFVGNNKLISRALVNLVNNAYRYGNKNGNIFVSLKSEGDEIILLVQDDGIGIKEEDQEKIFHRFYQADSSRSGEGTGLGLAMVYEIMCFHNGEVCVTSEPGKGSTFILKFKNKKITF